MHEPAGHAQLPDAGARRRRARARWLAVGFSSAALVAAGAIAASLVQSGRVADPGLGLGSSPSPSANAGPSPGAAEVEVERATCLGLEIACHRLTLPMDPDDAEAGTIQVVFGRHEAEDERRGTLVIATGGPGSSGLEAVPYYLEVLPAAVTDRFDIVFFDHRGVGRSSALDCRDAELAVPRNDDPLEVAPALETATSSWVSACLAEAEVDSARLAAYATPRVADDIEAYRRFLGADELYLYGESYGTAVVQHYAAQYPDRIAGIVLDGPVDTTLDALEFAEGQLSSFWEVTLETFAACADDPPCSDDLGAEPIATWDLLVSELQNAPRLVDYPVSRTASETRELTLGSVTNLGLSMTYTEYERMLFLRALAAGVDGDAIPLLQFGSLYDGRDPETLDPITRRSRGTALFLAVHCRNYVDVPDRRSGLDGLRELSASLVEAGNPYAALAWDDLACLHGFAELGGEASRPGAPQGGFPTLVLTATADPATPAAWAERIADQASEGYLIRTRGGGHVTFGGGWSCPDDLVTDFLLYGDLPDQSVTECDGYVMEPYVPRMRESLAAYADVGDALVALERSLVSQPAYHLWDGYPTGGPCNHGGWLSLAWDGDDILRLDDCELIPGWPVNGTVRYAAEGTTTMELSVPDGELEYESSPFWEVRITGTLGGQPVEIERQVEP